MTRSKQHDRQRITSNWSTTCCCCSAHSSINRVSLTPTTKTTLLGLLFIILITSATVTCNQAPAADKPEDVHYDDAATTRDHYHEDLFIRPLVDGKLFAEFQFKTTYRKDIKNLRWENKFEIFPLSLADLVATTDLNKLHFSLTKGNWNYRNWGYPTLPSPPGAQIRVQFSKHNENPEKSWGRLVNSLSGKFCTSLSSANNKEALVTSKLSFVHEGDEVLYIHLPEETFCTENLTPWKKLLPSSSFGLASLLNAVNLFKSSYSSLSIRLEPVTEGKHETVQLTQTISVVFNPLNLFEGKQMWSLAKIFGNQIQRKSPLASHSRIYVDTTNPDDKIKLYPQSFEGRSLDIRLSEKKTYKTRSYAIFDINAIFANSSNGKTAFNLGVKQNQLFRQPPASSRPKIPVSLRTHIAGIGAFDGTIVATITNDHDEPVRVAYMDVVPNYLRVYLHTLTIRTRSGQELEPDKLNFVLSKDKTPTLIEFSVMIPPLSETQISYDFERAFLRWSDYKPDANKGVLVGSALITVSLRCGLSHLVFPAQSVASNASSIECGSALEGDVLKVYARPLLIILPTPDFSMPYNVICFVCTTLVAAFGPLHSMTTRKPVIKVDKRTLNKDGENESKKNK